MSQQMNSIFKRRAKYVAVVITADKRLGVLV